ncbi:MAG: hypothetical protein MJ245_01635 [Clostridia bacterium]|nr:hypothetical protein [Clostridia bacterium]
MKIILFTFLGILLAVFTIVLIIYLVIRTLLDHNGFKGRSMMSIYKDTKRVAMQDKNRVKNVGGLTQVLLPTIKTYFPDFNENEFYNLVELNIRKVLDAISNKKEGVLNDKSLSLVKDKIELKIKNMGENDITYVFKDIVFHKHAIKDFKKDAGKATLIVTSALEYYFEQYDGDKCIARDDLKKQTRYQTEFVYIYDVQKAGYDIKAIGLNCPNCGSPIMGYGQKICSYCKSGIDISTLDFLKTWKIIDFKEDY